MIERSPDTVGVERGRVLVVDDDVDMAEMLVADLGRRGFDVVACGSADEALLAVGERDYDAVVSDLKMRGMSGVQLCERLVANRPDIAVVVMTAFGSMDTAVAAIRAGAHDFITKPFETEQLVLTLERALRHRALREEVKRLRLAVTQSQRLDDILGSSPSMRQLHDLVERVAESESSVLITGETGTGKELVARALHARSRRSAGPFVGINCAAMPETLLESELFGHVKGAFTDAKSERTGLFLQADGGTLFLDEIGDLPLGLQPKLLRALQERTVRPVGGNAETPFDARIIAATNRDLETAVEEQRFREDLYFRINVIQVPLPPLRSRAGDVLFLAQHFLQVLATRAGKNVSGLSPAAAEKLLAYTWPGNVRELQNCVERAVALARYEEIAVEDLPEKLRSYRASHVLLASDDPSELVPMEEVERRYIARVLHAVGGNKSLAAKVLGLDRTTLYRKLGRYGIAAGETREPQGGTPCPKAQ